MAKKDTGVYQLEDGCWGYRFTRTIDGKKKDVKRIRDDAGNPFKTKREAVKARTHAMKQDVITDIPKTVPRKTVTEVFVHFK